MLAQSSRATVLVADGFLNVPISTTTTGASIHNICVVRLEKLFCNNMMHHVGRKMDLISTGKF